MASIPPMTTYGPEQDMLGGNGYPQLPRGFGPGMDILGGGPAGSLGALAIDIPEEQPIDEFQVGPDGLMQPVAPDIDELPAAQPEDFKANLAEFIDPLVLDRMGVELCEQIEQDIEDRQPWADRFKRGLELMGLAADTVDDGPFPGASTAVHPLISEAVVQFWARSLAELVPADGPVRSKTLGQQTQQKLERGQRIQDYLNHEILFVDDSWYAEMSRLLFAVPYQGCAFKKIYRDVIGNRNVSIYVQGEDMIVPANVTDLRTGARYTHRIWRTANELRRAQNAGMYSKIDLTPPTQEDISEPFALKLETQDVTISDDSENARHELYECYCEWDLPGFEDADASGPTGIELPYVITIDRESKKILSIYRNWKASDPVKRRRVNFVKYEYVPGLGFYGLGLIHLIGGLQQAATGALREILDSGATASLQGGFIAKDANIRGERLEIEPGVWKPVDATAEELSKAFYTPPFKEPSAALQQLLQFLTSRAEKFTATTELMTGETNAKAPVGSTIAVIEQAAKVFSTIHKGLHLAMAQELRLRLELVQEYMPPGGYPYDVEGAHQGLMEEDFAPGVSIQPVSDPNIFSSAQRVAIAQAGYQIAMENPDVLKKPEAIRRVLQAIKFPDIDEIMVSNDPPEPMDPVSEIQAILRGQPVQAYPDQLHEAYLQHYAAFLQNPQFGAHPEVMKNAGPAIMAAVGQRLAYAWATHARALSPPGAQPPMLPPPSVMMEMKEKGGNQLQIAGPQGPGMPVPGQPPQAPPEVIAQVAAQIAPQMAKVPGLPVPPPPDDQVKQGELALKEKELGLKEREIGANLALKDREIGLKEQEIGLKSREVDINAQTVQQDAEIKRAQAEIDTATKIEQHQQKLGQQGELHSKTLAKVDAETLAAIEGASLTRDEQVKKAMHDDAKRQVELDKSKAEAVRAQLDANGAGQAQSQQDQMMQQILQVMAGVGQGLQSLAKAHAAPALLIKDANGKTIGARKLIDAMGSPDGESGNETPAKTKPKPKKKSTKELN